MRELPSSRMKYMKPNRVVNVPISDSDVLKSAMTLPRGADQLATVNVAVKRELKEERLAPKSELKEDDVTHHLVFAINRFLDRQAKKKSVDEEKAKKFEQARDLLKEAFDIPDDDSLKINQNLEG